jgi:hypothetical protein
MMAENRDNEPRLARFGVQCDPGEYETTETRPVTQPLFTPVPYTLHLEYVVKFTPRPGIDEPGRLVVRPVFNHRPRGGASTISVEFNPEGWEVSGDLASRIGSRANPRGPLAGVLGQRKPAETQGDIG